MKSLVLFGLTMAMASLLMPFSNARPSEVQPNESLAARVADTVSEIEWLLHQLVNILSEMTDGIEQDSTLLNNVNFRLILIQVIKRIDYILEHFETVGPVVLTPTVQYELQRIDCVRIRLANYVSQSKKFDDSQCRPTNNDKHKPGHGTSNEEIVPILTQIVSLLVQIASQLSNIEKELKPNQIATNAPTTVAYPLWTRPSTTVNWDDLISQFVSSKPVTDAGSTVNWDDIMSSIMAAASTPSTGNNNNLLDITTPATTTTTTGQDWNDLISQVMDSMGGTLTTMASTSAGTTTTTTTSVPMTTVWEDIMNDLIGQWSGSTTTTTTSSSVSNTMDVQDCVDSILSIINTIQNQLGNTTSTTTNTNSMIV